MKKILAILLTVLMICLLVACGNSNDTGSVSAPDGGVASDDYPTVSGDNDPQAGANDADSDGGVFDLTAFPNFIKQYIDLSHYKLNEYDASLKYSILDDFKGAYQKSFDVRLLSSPIKLEGDTVIYSGMSYADFTAQGWKLVRESAVDIEIEPHKMLTGLYSAYNGKEIRVLWANGTEATVTLPDTTVGSFDLELYDDNDHYLTQKASATDFIIEGKINNNSGLKDIIEALGEPSEVLYSVNKDNSCIELEYYDTGAESLQFYLSSNGDTIYRVWII